MAERVSWSFSANLGGETAHALFIRDAGRLPVGPAPGVPPRCSPPVPDLTALLTGVDIDSAAAQWVEWWHALVTSAGRVQLAGDLFDLSGDGGNDDWHRLHQQRASVFDPPQFTSMNGHPALHTVVRALYGRPDIWPQRPPGHGPAPLIGNGIAKHVVHEVARERQVSVDSLGACALVLPVEGIWWAVSGPGVVLASLQAARDHAAATELVRAAFMSAT